MSVKRTWNGPEGAVNLSEAQDQFIEWLVDPNRVGSQNDFARKLGVNPGTLSKWKKDGPFKEKWEKRLLDLNVSPDRIQQVVESLFVNAVGSGPQSVKAAELYLRFVDRFTPKEIHETRGSARDLSDEELTRSVEENIIALRRKA